MGLFDFNRDGTTSFFERAMGFAMLESLLEEETEADDFDDIEAEETLNQLRDELLDLENELITVEVNEPDDILSDAYTRWEQRRDLLEEQIDEVEQKIAELEA